MNRYRALAVIITAIVIVGVTACQSQGNRSSTLPTVASVPSATTTHTPTSTATATPLPSNTPTFTPTATITDTPIGALPVTPLTVEVIAVMTNTPAAVTFPPTLTPTSLPAAFVFGKSAQGKDLTAYRFGSGSRHILLIGGVHTGYETNTVGLVRELRAHFEAASGEIPPNVALILVPALNPDGLNYGEQLRGRFNANEVDLNRNWGCGWSPTAVFRDNPVNPGSAPFSEPEVQALGALIQQVNPYAVLFYHAAARGVFPGNCERHVSDGLAQVYADASGYPFKADFGDYTVTGSASGWVDSYGIPAVDVELATASDTEFWGNLRGVQAVMAWVAGMP